MANPPTPFFDPKAPILDVPRFCKAHASNQLIQVEQVSIPGPDVRWAFYFTKVDVFRETVTDGKRGRNETPDSHGYIDYAWYIVVTRDRSDVTQSLWYGRQPWQETTRLVLFDSPPSEVVEKAHSMDKVKNEYSANELPGGITVCYLFPGDHFVTLYDKDTRLYTRYRICTTMAAASALSQLTLAKDLRMRPVETATKNALNAADEANVQTWATATVRKYGDRVSQFMVIFIWSNQGDNVRLYLEKNGRDHDWRVVDRMTPSGKKLREVETWVLKVSCTSGDQFEAGDRWIRKDGQKGLTHWYHLLSTDQTPKLDNDTARVAVVQNTLGTENGTWEFATTFGDPNIQAVSLWLCVSPENLIVNRVVEKRWVRSRAGEKASDEEWLEMVEDEILHHTQLTRKPRDPIVQVRGSRERDPDRGAVGNRHVMYMEYAEGGDLNAIIYNHINRGRVPEIFVWLLFKNLVNACIMVEELGRCHSDIKPDNIFIRGPPAPTEDFSAYHQPILGDFGLLSRLDDFRMNGTNGFFTPEVRKYRRSGDPPVPVQRLHVYSIGLNIWCVMRLSPEGLGDQVHNAAFSFYGEGTEPRRDEYAPSSDYSARLEDLVKDCMEFDEEQRPSLKTLRKRIRHAIESWQARNPGVESLGANDLLRSERVMIGTDAYPLDGIFFPKKRNC